MDRITDLLKESYKQMVESEPISFKVDGSSADIVAKLMSQSGETEWTDGTGNGPYLPDEIENLIIQKFGDSPFTIQFEKMGSAHPQEGRGGPVYLKYIPGTTGDGGYHTGNVQAQKDHDYHGGESDAYDNPDERWKEDETEILDAVFGPHKGLNADWSNRAWLLKGNFPYGIWMVDEENGNWSIINREEKPASPGYTESGEYEDTELAYGYFTDMFEKARELTGK